MLNRSRVFIQMSKLICLSVSLTLVMVTMPRSPVWLRSRNLNTEAEKSIKWLGLESQSKIVESLNVIERGRCVLSFNQKSFQFY